MFLEESLLGLLVQVEVYPIFTEEPPPILLGHFDLLGLLFLGRNILLVAGSDFNWPDFQCPIRSFVPLAPVETVGLEVLWNRRLDRCPPFAGLTIFIRQPDFHPPSVK